MIKHIKLSKIINTIINYVKSFGVEHFLDYLTENDIELIMTGKWNKQRNAWKVTWSAYLPSKISTWLGFKEPKTKGPSMPPKPSTRELLLQFMKKQDERWEKQEARWEQQEVFNKKQEQFNAKIEKKLDDHIRDGH